MKQPWKVIKTLLEENSRLHKEAVIEREVREKNDVLFYGFRYALDSTMTFGIKQIPEKKDDGILIGVHLTWKEFVESLSDLVNRKITGNAAKTEVLRLMDIASAEEWNFWYRRILLKDLDCGVTETTINKIVHSMKAQDSYLIPVFSPQLAEEFSEKHKSGKKQIEVKRDGVRLLTFVYPDGRITQMSREGKAIENFTSIRKAFESVSNLLSDGWVFDGEITSSNFTELMKQLRRKEMVQTEDAVLYLFDMIPMKDFFQGRCEETQEVRSAALNVWYNLVGPLNNINIISSEIVDFNTKEGVERFEVLNKKALSDGHEGIMIKDINAPYVCKRGSNWLKLKPIETFDLVVVNLEEGTKKNTGSLGALVCEGIDSITRKKIKVNVGSGLTDNDRKETWDNPTSFIGRVAEIVADTVTTSQDGTYSLRFPRFNRWRGFETGEKL